MSLLINTEAAIEDYWVKWDPSIHEWEVSTDKGVTWRILAENPRVMSLIGLGGPLTKSPATGLGIIYFNGLKWKVREGLGAEQDLVYSLPVDVVHTADLPGHPVARFSNTGTSASSPQWGTEDFNEDSSIFEIHPTDTTLFRFKQAGTYLILANGHTNGATVDTGYSIALRKSTTGPTGTFTAIIQGPTHSGNTGGNVFTSFAGVIQAIPEEWYDFTSTTTATTTLKLSLIKLS